MEEECVGWGWNHDGRGEGEERGDILQITSSPPPTPKSEVVRMLPTLLTFTTLTFLAIKP